MKRGSFSEPGDRQALNHFPRNVALLFIGHCPAFLANLGFARSEEQITGAYGRPLQPVFLAEHGFKLTRRRIT